MGRAVHRAVQLQSLSVEERAAIEALAPQLRVPTPPPAAERLSLDGETAVRLLESLERRAAAGHYELLDLPPEAGLPEAREKARGMRRQVEDLRSRLPPAAQVSRVAALVEKIEQAAHVLGKPAERLMHDARHGNFRGVARCVTAGVPLPLVASRRQGLLAERPALEAEAQRRLARARVAEKLGNTEAALVELEAALQADPLNLELHELHASLEVKVQARPRVG